jgi:alpha-D-ribose 1-methylphosphonate 5-phosphate C-P lyase
MNERRTNSMAMVDRALGWREPGEEERYVVNPSPIPKFENPNL